MASWKTEVTVKPTSGDGSVPESGGAGPWLLKQRASSFPSVSPACLLQPRGHLQLILPARLLPCQRPSAPHPPQGFQDLGPEFHSIFAQTKQEDGSNTSPCCCLSDALVSCSSKACGHLWPPPSTSPASTDLAMQNEWSQVIRGSLQISSPPDLSLDEVPPSQAP